MLRPHRGSGVSRGATVRQADLDRALRTATKHGLTVASYKIGPDGSIEVLTVEGAPAQRDELAEWRARVARRNQGA